MRVVNPTDLRLALLPGRIGFPGHSLTVVVKGLYRLLPERLGELLDHELAFPTGDIPVDEGEEDSTEIRYASDFAYFKPRADLMLVGRCHPPDGRPVASSRVTFRVGDRGRSLMVFGDRFWRSGVPGAGMTAPEPFTEMALGWARAYGGSHSPDNPVGRGDGPVDAGDGWMVRPLPNIEDLSRRIGTLDDRPVPAGFGPVAPDWEPRRSKVGTYRGRWTEERWPWFPEDLDWGYFNAAPSVLQADGFLRGDEEIYLENIHPEHPDFRARLPGVRVRCFLNELPEGIEPPPPTEKDRREWPSPPLEQMVFREIPLKLDTLWVDSEEAMVALVWRGHGAVRSEEFAEIQDLFIMAEPLQDSPADLDTCHESFRAVVQGERPDEGSVEPAAERDASGSGLDPAADASVKGGDEEDEEQDPAEDSMARLREDLEAMGIDPDDPPEPTEEEKARAKEFFRERGMHDVVALLEETEEEETEEDKAPPRSWTRERVLEKYADDRDLSGADLRGLDLSELDLPEVDLTAADLTGANLARSKLSEANLTGAEMARADLSDAELPGAALSGCGLTEARLSGATLSETDLTGARMNGAVLEGADLAGAVLEGAALQRADLTAAAASDAVFVDADLTEAILLRGEFQGADFTGAVLDRVDAREASFRSAEFARVRALEAVLAGADLEGLRAADALDLSGANLSQVEATESVWSGATLAGASLAWAVLNGADFTGANLQGADLYAARLREARFSKANLVDARLAAADAFEARFDKADLARADMRAGSFYAAEFLEARFWETSAEGANLKMTKHG